VGNFSRQVTFASATIAVFSSRKTVAANWALRVARDGRSLCDALVTLGREFPDPWVDMHASVQFIQRKAKGTSHLAEAGLSSSHNFSYIRPKRSHPYLGPAFAIKGLYHVPFCTGIEERH
jgi:hypothetical protein